MERMGLLPPIPSQEPAYLPVLSHIRAGGLSAPAEQQDQDTADFSRYRGSWSAAGSASC